jgi:hypothetical protein
MAAHIKDYRAIKLLGRDETTIADITGTLMPSTGGTVSILATTSTIPVSFATSSTVQAAGTVGLLDASKNVINPAKEDGSLAVIKTNTDKLDILLSALRDAITAASPNNKTLNDLYAKLVDLLTELQQKTEPTDTQPVSEVAGANIDLNDLLQILKQLAQSPLGRLAIDSTGRLRIIIDAAGVATPISTVTTLSAITTFPYGQSWEMIQRSNIEYNEGQRSKFTFV